MGKKQKEVSEKTIMRTYRFRPETIEALEFITNAVNKKTNIKISTTGVLQLLILNARKEKDVEKIIHSISSDQLEE